MQTYHIYMIGFPIFVVLFIIFYWKTVGNKTSKMQHSCDFDKPILEEFNKYLQNDEKLEHYIEANWKKMFSFKLFYLGITNKRLILVKVTNFFGDMRNADKNILEVAEKYDNIQNLKIKDVKILEQGNMQSIWYPGKEISFSVNNKNYVVKIKYGGSYRKNHDQELDIICSVLSQKIHP